MKDTITQRLDDNDIECVNGLRRLGFDSCMAKTVVALISGGKTQFELTGCTGENQSSVSKALRNLVKVGYVDVSELLHTEGKGRPKSLYTIESWDAFVDVIEKEAMQEITNKNAEIERLKELTS